MIDYRESKGKAARVLHREPKSTPAVNAIIENSINPCPLDQSPRAISGGMEHEEQKDPVA